MEICETSYDRDIHLEWNDHGNNFLQFARDQKVEKKFSDVVLYCDGYHTEAHKVVLAACSNYFQELLLTFEDVPKPLVALCGVGRADLQRLLEFAYKGTVRVPESSLEGFLAAARMLQIKGLANAESPREGVAAVGGDSRQRRRSTEVIVAVDCGKREESTPMDLSMKENKNLKSIKQFEKSIPSFLATYSKSVFVKRELEMKSPLQTVTSTSTYAAKGSRTEADELPFRKRRLVAPVALGTKIPRPLNAFMIFANEWRRKVAIQYPVENNKSISVRLGELWRRMSPEEKQHYYLAAQTEDFMHKLKYPGYFYSPKEARIKKLLRNGKCSLEHSARNKLQQ